MNYLKKIRQLYGLDETANIGFSETEIVHAEKHLNIKFPKVLREYYLAIGKNININKSFNRLLKPGNEIDVVSKKYIVFYEENQASAYWAIKKTDLIQDNPSVYVNYSVLEEESHWLVDSLDIKSFLLKMALWNGVLGGLKYCANSESFPTDLIERIRANWIEVIGISHPYFQFFTNDYHEIIALTTNHEEQLNGLYIGSNDLDCYRNLIQVLNTGWDYRSDRDEI